MPATTTQTASISDLFAQVGIDSMTQVRIQGVTGELYFCRTVERGQHKGKFEVVLTGKHLGRRGCQTFIFNSRTEATCEIV